MDESILSTIELEPAYEEKKKMRLVQLLGAMTLAASVASPINTAGLAVGGASMPENNFNPIEIIPNSLLSVNKLKENIIEKNYININKDIYDKEYKIIQKNNDEDGQTDSYIFGESIRPFSQLFVEPGPRWNETERQAHRFRSGRMRIGLMGEIAAVLQSRPDAKKAVSVFVRRSKALLAGTQRDSELHRAYAPLIAGMMNEPEMSKLLLGSMDAVVTQESEGLKTEARETGITTDVLVIGTGVHGAIFSSGLRSERPDLRIVSIDESDKLGGQFRSYGERPTFFINSRNFRPQNNDVLALPGQEGNLNSFGDKVPVQVTDISTETYPTNVELGVTAAINQYLSAENMMGVELEKVEQEGPYTKITVRDKETGEIYTIQAKEIVVTSGLGERKAFKDEEIPNIWTVEDVLRHFANPDNLFPMDVFAGKKVAIRGGGDSGRIMAELMTRLGPAEAYGKSAVQFGGPEVISWFGTDFEDRAEFCEKNRPRYQRLASFIPKRRGSTVQKGQIIPRKDKVTSVRKYGDKVQLFSDNGSQGVYDIVIDATQLSSTIFDPFKDIGASLQPVEASVPGLGFATIARSLGNSIFFAGPVARLPLTDREKRSFADGITENTASIWANQIRTNELARKIALEL